MDEHKLRQIYRDAQKVRAYADRTKNNNLGLAMLDAMKAAKIRLEGGRAYIPEYILRNIEEGLKLCATTTVVLSR